MTGEKVKVLQSGIFSFPDFLPRALFSFSTREFEFSRDLTFFVAAMGGCPDSYSAIEQVHGSRVLAVPDPCIKAIPEADGHVTDKPGLALVIRTADCAPVFFFDPDRPAIGLSHAGWRGAQKKVLSETLRLLEEKFQSKPEKLRIAIGPSICFDCYGVGEEFGDYFPGFVQKRGGEYLFNLRGALKQELLEKGVRKESIVESGFCTACSVDQFFSARKEGVQTGRLISAAMLKYAP